MDSWLAASACIACYARCRNTYHLLHFSKCPSKITELAAAERAGLATHAAGMVVSRDLLLQQGGLGGGEGSKSTAAALAADFGSDERHNNLKPGTWSGSYWQSVQ